MYSHEHYMLRCIELARKGAGYVAPNPMVGSVVVHNNTIVGEGWHEKFGKAHAEVNAIQSVKDAALLASSTLYVNLEPCSHFGKTPPCVNLIIENKIPRVVIGMMDPFEKVSGQGIAMLKQAGVEVITDTLKTECELLNKRFITFVNKKRPYIILKWAQSADGYIAPDAALLSASAFEKKRHITGFVVQKLLHKWRSEEAAIMVGTHTIVTDNPALNVRAWNGQNPLRITIDKENKLLVGGFKFFDGHQRSLVFCSKHPDCNIEHLEFVELDFSLSIWPQVANALYERNIQSLIIEGGSYTLHSILQTDLWDEIQVFTTDAFLGNGVKAPVVNAQVVSEIDIDTSHLRIYLNR